MLGQLHSALDSFDASSSFTGLLSRFNVWDRNLTEASDVERISQACCAEIGNVVPWPEVYLRLEGHFVKQTSSLCAYPGEGWHIFSVGLLSLIIISGQ